MDALKPEDAEKAKFEGFSYQGNDEDGSALTKLRRNSRDPEAWDTLTRKISSASERSRGPNKMAMHARMLSDIADETNNEEKEEKEEKENAGEEKKEINAGVKVHVVLVQPLTNSRV